MENEDEYGFPGMIEWATGRKRKAREDVEGSRSEVSRTYALPEMPD